MEELRVPTVPIAVRINYFDERELEGKIFLPAMAATHSGPATPQDWLNSGTSFFPFLPSGESKSVILNKSQIIVLTILSGMDENFEASGVERRVEVYCGELLLEGIVVIDMPTTQSRLLDWISRQDPFLTLKGGDTVRLIQKSRITKLSEVVEAKSVD